MGGRVPEHTLRLFGGSAEAKQAAVEGDKPIGNNRRRRCTEVASGRENGLHRQFLLSVRLLEERRLEMAEPRELAASICLRPHDALVQGERGVTWLSRSNATRVEVKYASATQGCANKPTSFAFANASSDKATARSVLPHQASSKPEGSQAADLPDRIGRA